MSNRSILLADDDPAIRLMVATVLKRLGYTVEIASGGKEALRIFAQNSEAFEILITDHSMPEITGLELVGHLRKNGFEGKIIVMSGSLTRELETAYKAKCINTILQKPFAMESLATALENLFINWKRDDPPVK